MIKHALSLLPLSLLLLVLGAPQANAAPQVHTDKERQFTLTYSESLKPSKAPIGSKALLHVKRDGLRASVTAFESANRAAFQRDKNDAFFDTIERGLAKVENQYRRRSRKSQRLQRAPILDLVFSRVSSTGAREMVWMRFLFRYRFTVVATAITPMRASGRLKRLARNFSQSLVPLSAP